MLVVMVVVVAVLPRYGTCAIIDAANMAAILIGSSFVACTIRKDANITGASGLRRRGHNRQGVPEITMSTASGLEMYEPSLTV